ncbi:MAG TPA: hypothetical protein VFC33_06845 [Acidimicrobiia bacterium]|nr:hypothetical protein [Acidimicrobiia bacterium]
MTGVPRNGWFVASEEAAHLSAAPHLQGERVPVSTVVTDDRLDVRFALPNGEHTDLTAEGYDERGCWRGSAALVLHDAAGATHAVQYRWTPHGRGFVLVFETDDARDVVAGRLDLDDS